MSEHSPNQGGGQFRRWLRAVLAMLMRDSWVLLGGATMHFFLLYPLRSERLLFGPEAVQPWELERLLLFYLAAILLGFILPWCLRYWHDMAVLESSGGGRRERLRPGWMGGVIALLPLPLYLLAAPSYPTVTGSPEHRL